MPNYNANANGASTRFQPQGKPLEEIAPKPTNTKHYLRVWEVLRKMDAPAAYIRDAVREKMIRDGLLTPESQTTVSQWKLEICLGPEDDEPIYEDWYPSAALALEGAKDYSNGDNRYYYFLEPVDGTEEEQLMGSCSGYVRDIH